MPTAQEIYDEIMVNNVDYYDDLGIFALGPSSKFCDRINAIVPGSSVTRKQVDPLELISSIPLAEWEAVSDARRAYLTSLISVSGGTVDASDSVVWDNLLALFPAGSDARTNIQAKVQREGSRAEILWGEGTFISTADMGAARRIAQGA